VCVEGGKHSGLDIRTHFRALSLRMYRISILDVKVKSLELIAADLANVHFESEVCMFL
jgi:hypothetical protein